MFHNFLCKYQKLCQEYYYIQKKELKIDNGKIEKKKLHSSLFNSHPDSYRNYILNLIDTFCTQEFFQAFDITEQHLTGLTSLERTNNSISFQLVYNSSGPVITQF